MNDSMWWLAWLIPAVRPLATLVVAFLLGTAHRTITGTWPTMADWRPASTDLSGPWTVLARAVAVIRTTRRHKR